MDLVRGVADDGAARNSRMRASLVWIDILERQGIFVQVGAVRVPANAEIIIGGQAAQTERRVAAFRIIAIQVVGRFAQQAQRIKIGPAFPHAPGLEVKQTGAAANPSVAQTMNVLVDDDFPIQIPVAIRVRPGEFIHLHAGRKTIGRGRHVRIIVMKRIQKIQSVLSVRQNGIVAEAAAPEIVALKISRRFGEAQFVELVMNPVVPIEKLDHGSVAIGSRFHGQV